MSINDFVSIPLPIELVSGLAQRNPTGINSIVEFAVRDFLERTGEGRPRIVGSRSKGIYWDRLFLPEKTRLRTRYFGAYRYGDVRGDQIIYEGKPVATVSQLARRMRNNTCVNAWMHVEVLRPSDIEWVKADRLRRSQ
jgi:hypothetical protein